DVAQTLTINGQGSYMGLPKAVNGQEIASPGDAPGSIIYNAYEQEDGSLLVAVEVADGGWWNYKFIKTAEPPPPSPFQGTWVVASEAGSLGVGPAEFDVSWWSGDDGVIAVRDCFYDDEYVFNPDGSFKVETQGSTWVEAWQGGTDACDAPVAPHDGSIPGSWSHDQDAGTLTITGQGSYVGLPKAVNGAEIASPSDAPGSIVYNATPQDDGSMSVTVEVADGGWWSYKIVKIAEPAGPSPISGTWYMAESDGSLGVGPAEFDVSWWSNDAGVTALRSCYFDDAFVFGDDGSFTNDVGADTWVEVWQGGDDSCAAPVAPHDGSIPATFSYDGDAQTLVITGQGSYIGLPKAVNGAEIGSPGDAPGSISYNAYLNDDGTMSVSVEVADGGWWSYLLTR
ncbi:glycoside hydrolase family 16 protein, partial [Luminiphilus sp.]|nr:glycoside hydrolase family 16 protein [Luminiphilus sp.]